MNSTRRILARVVVAFLLVALTIPASLATASESSSATGTPQTEAARSAFASYHRRSKKKVRKVRRVRRRAVRRRVVKRKKRKVVRRAPVAAPAPAPAPPTETSATAQAALDALKQTYPRYLEGTTASIGDARGSEAISYYTIGSIVVSPTHRTSMSVLMNHEIWHVIDWRDNGRIDWGESVPPTNWATYQN